jgi:hypothetical protein
MKVQDLTGRTHQWNLSEYTPAVAGDIRPRSDLHVKARQLLNVVLPNHVLLEEVILPGTRLAVDFFLPTKKLAIEVQGAQHTKYIPHFHGSIIGYMEQKKRDIEKQEWLRINNIRLVYFDYRETVDDWTTRLTED